MAIFCTPPAGKTAARHHRDLHENEGRRLPPRPSTARGPDRAVTPTTLPAMTFFPAMHRAIGPVPALPAIAAPARGDVQRRPVAR